MARVELQLSPTKQQLVVMSTRSLRKNSFRQVLHCAGLHSTVFGVENSHLQNQVGIFLYLKKHTKFCESCFTCLQENKILSFHNLLSSSFRDETIFEVQLFLPPSIYMKLLQGYKPRGETSPQWKHHNAVLKKESEQLLICQEQRFSH